MDWVISVYGNGMLPVSEIWIKKHLEWFMDCSGKLYMCIPECFCLFPKLKSSEGNKHKKYKKEAT